MCAIGRAMMANPNMILLDEPSMGLAPQIVEEIFEIVRDLNTRGRELPAGRAEHHGGAAPRGLRLHPENGRVVMDGAAEALRDNEDVRSSTWAWRPTTPTAGSGRRSGM